MFAQEVTDASASAADLQTAADAIKAELADSAHAATVTVKGRQIVVVIRHISKSDAATVAPTDAMARLLFRPVHACSQLASATAPSSVPELPNQSQALPFGTSAACEVGPSRAHDSALAPGVYLDQTTAGGWEVGIPLRNDPTKTATLNALLKECGAKGHDCPAGQVAITFNGEILSVSSIPPGFQTDGVSFAVQTGEQAAAQKLERVVASTTLPVVIKVVSSTWTPD